MRGDLDVFSGFNAQANYCPIYKVEAEKTKLESKSIGVAFVTFSNLEIAEKVKKDHQKFLCGRSDIKWLPRLFLDAISSLLLT